MALARRQYGNLNVIMLFKYGAMELVTGMYGEHETFMDAYVGWDVMDMKERRRFERGVIQVKNENLEGGVGGENDIIMSAKRLDQKRRTNYEKKKAINASLKRKFQAFKPMLDEETSE